MSRQVSDTEFNKARKEYLSYMKSVAQKYANALSPDMLSAAIDMACGDVYKTISQSTGKNYHLLCIGLSTGNVAGRYEKINRGLVK